MGDGQWSGAVNGEIVGGGHGSVLEAITEDVVVGSGNSSILSSNNSIADSTSSILDNGQLSISSNKFRSSILVSSQLNSISSQLSLLCTFFACMSTCLLSALLSSTQYINLLLQIQTFNHPHTREGEFFERFRLGNFL